MACQITIYKLQWAALREEKAGFRKGNNCYDEIFILRNTNSIDFEKVFDSFQRASSWHCGVPSKIVALINSLDTSFVEFRYPVGRSYLGSVVTSGGSTDEDIEVNLGKARGSVITLKKIWKSNSISRITKIKLYNSGVLSALLYGADD